MQQTEVSKIKPHFLDVGGGERWAVIITGLFNEANRGANFISYNTAKIAYWVYSPIFHAKAL